MTWLWLLLALVLLWNFGAVMRALVLVGLFVVAAIDAYWPWGRRERLRADAGKRAGREELP